eukprot:6863532-Prymnesium_polylepis.1
MQHSMCTAQDLVRYKALGTLELPWHCPRFISAGLWMGRVRDVVGLLDTWQRPGTRYRKACASTPPGTEPAYVEQCVLTQIFLGGHASIALDTFEHLVASAGSAQQCTRALASSKRDRCWECGRKRNGTEKTLFKDVADRCAAVPTFDWHLVFATGSTSSASSRAPVAQRSWRLRRTGVQEQSACRTAETGPLLLHFSGPGKRRMYRALASLE